MSSLGFVVRNRSFMSACMFVVCFAFNLLTVFKANATEETQAQGLVDYDIVYVRYPATDPDGSWVTISQGEQHYKVAAGADLMLLHPDGSETVLVDCEVCSVVDPYISNDGKTVYYALISEPEKESASYIYKINLTLQPYTPVRLTFNDGFNSLLYAGNQSYEHDQANWRDIRDMAPVPLADGRLLFTSNRAGLTAFNAGTDAVINGSVQQLYVMDDHDGNLTNAKLANIRPLETGNLHGVQHPMQLKDGRILFSSWQDAGHKFKYAMTSLFTINPDGTNLRQFTEPHDHAKALEHYVTQLPNEDVITGFYYPSYDFGFGVLLKYPLDPEGPDFLRGRTSFYTKEDGSPTYMGNREFDRKDASTLTPHTTPRDIPAPDRSGKYSMPSVGKNGNLLVAYSTGYVNHFNSVCARKNQPYQCENLKSGIYMIPNAADNVITDPAQLVKLKDDENYNEIWPRAVASYQDLYGVASPLLVTDTMTIAQTYDATAIVGTSSMYNRDPEDESNHDPFQARSTSRERHDGNWTIQGAHAGVFSNEDIYAVRIIATPPKPYTKPIKKYGDYSLWNEVIGRLPNKRLEKIVARSSSFHAEKWEILGEFPLVHKQNGLVDPQGNLDTSWQARIPADTPFLIQALDKNGMTLISEQTWRALKPNEKRVDCGGCHAHSIEPLDYENTASGMNKPLNNVAGVDDYDPRIANGTWDLTTGSIPLLTEQGVSFEPTRIRDVEFKRDVYPILQQECSACHQSAEQKPNLVGTDDEVYAAVTYPYDDEGIKYKIPQISKYIRSPQARQSLLVWVAYNQRLDGRTNETRTDDVDYPQNHPTLELNDRDKRTLARWIDLGGPMDFPQTDGFGYTDDSQLPVLVLVTTELTPSTSSVKFSAIDAKSGLDVSSLAVKLYQVESDGVTQPQMVELELSPEHLVVNNVAGQANLYEFALPHEYMQDNTAYVLKLIAADNAQNINEFTQYFTY
ncbi:hypothetical protein ACMZOO_11495 [Catenovulum sp. SX2]|uniref:HzsA-related protein n=1 Tax=Catenovulum sp. SX2 TaxID=3398614 RepID=UPI003F82A859